MKQFFQAANKNINLRGSRQERHKRLVSDNTDDESDGNAVAAACSSRHDDNEGDEVRRALRQQNYV